MLPVGVIVRRSPWGQDRMCQRSAVASHIARSCGDGLLVASGCEWTASDELAAQVGQFLASGGQFEEAAPYNYTPKPITYSNQMPPAPKPFVRRRVEADPLPLDKKDIRTKARIELTEQIRQLGVTHTQTEVAAAFGVSRRLIYNHAKRYDITFKETTRGGARNLAAAGG